MDDALSALSDSIKEELETALRLIAVGTDPRIVGETVIVRMDELLNEASE